MLITPSSLSCRPLLIVPAPNILVIILLVLKKRRGSLTYLDKIAYAFSLDRSNDHH